MEKKNQELAVIVMGSMSDEKYADKIGEELTKYGVDFKKRVGSAHKTPWHLLNIISNYEGMDDIVFIAIAGRSNALGGFIDCQTKHPVISAPPFSKEFRLAGYLSSLDMPNNVGATVGIYPSIVAMHTAKIFGRNNPEIAKKIKEIQEEAKMNLIKADQKIKKL